MALEREGSTFRTPRVLPGDRRSGLIEGIVPHEMSRASALDPLNARRGVVGRSPSGWVWSIRRIDFRTSRADLCGMLTISSFIPLLLVTLIRVMSKFYADDGVVEYKFQIAKTQNRPNVMHAMKRCIATCGIVPSLPVMLSFLSPADK